MGFELLELGFAVSKTKENGNGIYIFISYTGISNNWNPLEGLRQRQKKIVALLEKALQKTHKKSQLNMDLSFLTVTLRKFKKYFKYLWI